MTMLAIMFFAGFFLAAVLYEKELKRWARDVSRHVNEPFSPTPRYSTKGWTALRDALTSHAKAADDKTREQREENLDYRRALSALGHDMRTPLAGAKGYVQLAQGTELGNDAEAWLAASVRRMDDVEALVDQLSAFVRATDPDRVYRAEQVAVLPLVLEVLGGYETQFAEKGWEPAITFADEALCITADAASVRRIVDNLVSNALKYGAGGLRIIQTNADAGAWSLEVSNALGPRGDFDPVRAFDRSWRAISSTEKTGLGLGLSIAKSLAADMGLGLTARREGERAVFELSPVAPPAEALPVRPGLATRR